MIPADVQSLASRLLACPRCHESLTSTGSKWACMTCGVVAIAHGGIIDFLHGISQLSVAGRGVWNLDEDRVLGERLLTVADRFSHEELAERVRLQRDGADTAAKRRFNDFYCKVSKDVGLRHGSSILEKVDTRLQENLAPPLQEVLAIEAGGGEGRYLPGFADRFQQVVFIDGSLSNVVLAQVMARDQGLTNILFVRADITALPLAEGVASFVHANGVIEHVHDPTALVEGCLRVAATDGYVVIVSPNRIPITREPHFRLPLFGVIPKFVRKPLIRVTRGKDSEAGTDLLSIWGLRRVLRRSGGAWDVFVVPATMRSTARTTPLRSLLTKALSSPLGSVVAWIVNHVLIPIAHSHIAIGHHLHQKDLSRVEERS